MPANFSAAQRRLHALEIGIHQRLDIGVGDRRRGALVFAHLGTDLARQRDPEAGQLLLQDVARAPLVRRIGVGMHEGDGDAFRALALELARGVAHRLLVERQADMAMHVHALGHREAQRARHQRLGLLDGEVVLVVAAFVGDIEDVAEALGGEQRRARAAPLDHGVGGERRAVHEHGDIAEAAPGIGQDQPHTVENRLLGPLRRGQQLARQPLPALFQHHVRERAADVDGNAQIPDHLQSRPISCKRGATVDRPPLRCNSQARMPMVAA